MYIVSNDFCYTKCNLIHKLTKHEFKSIMFELLINSRKKPPEEINIKYSVNHQGYNCGFKGEMINNDLYKSADDVIGCQKDDDVIQSSLKRYPAAPYYNLKMTYSKLEPEKDPYSYASKF